MDAQPRNNSGKFFLNKYASAITRLNSNNHTTEVAFESGSDRFTNDSDNDSDKETYPDDWTAGRRVVELLHLAEQMKCCKHCNSPLLLHMICGEKRCGLGSFLYIQCVDCPFVNPVTTGKQHRQTGKDVGMLVFDVNTKLSLAYLDAGMGPVQTVNFITALNIPCISPNNLKAREREIGKTIEEYARSSCKKALEEEYLMNRNDRTIEEDTELDKSLDVSFDGGWQKRGSGRSYNSTTGHATVIGNVSGKCLHFGLKSTDCRKCNYIDEKGDASEKEHDCRRNYLGSSKAMEPALAVEMVKDIEEMGYMVNSLTMDDDTTTMARLRQEVDHDVIKRSDSNHFRKNFTGDLLQLHQKHKRSISTTVIDYFVKDMLYAIKQNKGDIENLKSTISAIVPHAFGDHSLCSSWCGYIKDPIGYRHKSLPYGKDLEGVELQRDIQTVFSKYSENTDKLANLGSSQSNESLNYIISTKAPKSKHFGGSQSLGFRVASAISQKNEGRSYVVEVNKNHSLSPGKFTSQQRERMDRKRKREKTKAATPAFKRKRRDKKGSRARSVRSKEIREGDCYRSAISSTDKESPDIEEIPAPTTENDDFTLHLGKTSTVFFDLETTGLGISCDITQIAAVCGTNKFSQYVMPLQPITPGASKVTGLTRIGNVLYRNGIPVPYQNKEECLKEFISWLPENAVLFGHNIKSFDTKIIIQALTEEDLLNGFKAKCNGFVDTLHVFRAEYPERKSEKKSFKQEELVKDFLGENFTYDAHNALGDVLALQELFGKAGFSLAHLQPHSFSVDFAYQTLINIEISNTNYESLKLLPISAGMTKKMAKSGLNIQHLKLAFRRGGVDGVCNVMSEENNGKVRVTKNKKILVAAAQFIKDEIANQETAA